MNKGILILFLLLLGLILLLGITNNTEYSGNKGYYNGGVIKLNLNNINNYDEYLSISNHEYSHFIWDRLLTKEEKAAWIKIVKKKGFESGYPNIERNWHKYNEEFATCRELMTYSFSDCPCDIDKQIYIYNIWTKYVGGW